MQGFGAMRCSGRMAARARSLHQIPWAPDGRARFERPDRVPRHRVYAVRPDDPMCPRRAPAPPPSPAVTASPAPAARGPSRTDRACRLFGLVARDARTAVVFRRGPSKQVRMLRWDLATDAVTPGQWLSGRVYAERCGLSPDGRLVVYFAGKFKTKLGTFTAVSRPPYFTALALWPEGSTYGGGGYFEDDRTLILNYRCALKELNDGATIPASFVVGHLGDDRPRRPDGDTAAASQGWSLASKGADGAPTAALRYGYAPPRVYEKPHPTRAGVSLERNALGMGEVNGPFVVYGYRVLVAPSGRAREPAATELGRLDWADWDHDGSLLYAADGRLYRRDVSAGAADAPRVKLVADLRDQVFESVPAPDEARRWP